eukprot:29398-Pelagococcus_subviridis.AAC.4
MSCGFSKYRRRRVSLMCPEFITARRKRLIALSPASFSPTVTCAIERGKVGGEGRSDVVAFDRLIFRFRVMRARRNAARRERHAATVASGTRDSRPPRRRAAAASERVATEKVATVHWRRRTPRRRVTGSSRVAPSRAAVDVETPKDLSHGNRRGRRRDAGRDAGRDAASDAARENASRDAPPLGRNP